MSDLLHAMFTVLYVAVIIPTPFCKQEIEPEYTVPFVAWNTRNFKPEYMVEWKTPLGTFALARLFARPDLVLCG